MNQILIQHLDPAAWRAEPPGRVRTIAAIFTHMHNVRSKWIRLTAPHLKVPRQLNRAHCTPQQARAGLAESAARSRRCSLKHSVVVGAGSGCFAETAGPGLGRLAWKCCATCFLTKPTIAGRCVCSRISSNSRCRTRWRMGSGIGKSCGKSPGRLAAPATILKKSLKDTFRSQFGFPIGVSAFSFSKPVAVSAAACSASSHCIWKVSCH